MTYRALAILGVVLLGLAADEAAAAEVPAACERGDLQCLQELRESECVQPASTLETCLVFLQRLETLRRRSRSPGLALLLGNTLQGIAAGVPGMVRGTALALENWGRLPLAQVIAPAIALADDGFAATPRYSDASCSSRARNSPEAEAYFCPGGVPPAVGSLVQNKPLAATFRLIAQNGPDCFYKYQPEIGCDIAKGIVEGQKFNRPQAPNGKGGSMTLADLENYQAAVRAPIEGTYRGYVIRAMSPPSSGGLTMIQMLKMLERFTIGDAGEGYGFGSLKTVNVMAEAMRLAFADRSIWMGDSDFVHVPAKGLLHTQYVNDRSALIFRWAELGASFPSEVW